MRTHSTWAYISGATGEERRCGFMLVCSSCTCEGVGLGGLYTSCTKFYVSISLHYSLSIYSSILYFIYQFYLSIPLHHLVSTALLYFPSFYSSSCSLVLLPQRVGQYKSRHLFLSIHSILAHSNPLTSPSLKCSLNI